VSPPTFPPPSRPSALPLRPSVPPVPPAAPDARSPFADDRMTPVPVRPGDPLDPDEPDDLFPRRRPDLAPGGVDAGAQGRHVSGGEHHWGWVAGWTVLGTMLPGAGLIAAGRRRTGGIVLGLAILLPVLVGAVLLKYGAVDSAIALGTDQNGLLLLMAEVALGGVVLASVTYVTNRELLRHASTDSWTRGANAVLVLVLVGAVVVPAGFGVDYLRITRATIPSVFDDSAGSSTRPNSESNNPWAGIPRVNVLLLGSDADEDRDGVRTDSMILASINTTTGDTTLLSPPRNLQRVPFREDSRAYQAWPYGFGNTRGGPWPRNAGACGAACDLSAVWRWGVENRKKYYPGEKNPGAMALRDAIEGAFGLDIDAHIVVDIDGFKAVVDALGGLRLDVHNRLPIGGTTAHPVTGKWIEPGLNQKLNGYEALWFARSRSLSSDYDRMARQRCVIGAVVEQTDPVKFVKSYPGLARAAGDNISTDISSKDLDAWVDLGLKIKEAQVKSLPFTDKVISYGHPDYRQIRSLVRSALRSSGKSTPSVTPTPRTPVTEPGAGPTPKPGKTDPAKAADPTKAQDLKAVC
jgi:LCP family protein required for cell wall assembly